MRNFFLVTIMAFTNLIIFANKVETPANEYLGLYNFAPGKYSLKCPEKLPEHIKFYEPVAVGLMNNKPLLHAFDYSTDMYQLIYDKQVIYKNPVLRLDTVFEKDNAAQFSFGTRHAIFNFNTINTVDNLLQAIDVLSTPVGSQPWATQIYTYSCFEDSESHRTDGLQYPFDRSYFIGTQLPPDPKFIKQYFSIVSANSARIHEVPAATNLQEFVGIEFEGLYNNLDYHNNNDYSSFIYSWHKQPYTPKYFEGSLNTDFYFPDFIYGDTITIGYAKIFSDSFEMGGYIDGSIQYKTYSLSTGEELGVEALLDTTKSEFIYNIFLEEATKTLKENGIRKATRKEGYKQPFYSDYTQQEVDELIKEDPYLELFGEKYPYSVAISPNGITFTFNTIFIDLESGKDLNFVVPFEKLATSLKFDPKKFTGSIL